MLKRVSGAALVVVAMMCLAAPPASAAPYMKFWGGVGQATEDSGTVNLMGGGGFGAIAGKETAVAIEIGVYQRSLEPYRFYLQIKMFPVTTGKFRIGGGGGVDYDPTSCEGTDPYLASLGTCMGKAFPRFEGGFMYQLKAEGRVRDPNSPRGNPRYVPESIMWLEVMGGVRMRPGDISEPYITAGIGIAFNKSH